ncbi:hypothetical protein FM038_005105 [Shewanella eurypsychrophilus]|uniref:Uncharacterized protein n=1 Tax=Shewanella eurypsychrophilus TaxID=2593656 RepID=A0ABX6V2W5_9GAMM|nr:MULTISPECIES: hypothetical protein [Shewanella]QFU21588.1 hypothetical protein FS418_06685 [Shewanella sp. YLB-09]QPG56878.1 hypothetical protein FM038_005105 [Shewanella eurypsychrophilus]
MEKLRKGPLTIDLCGKKFPEWVENSEGYWDFHRAFTNDRYSESPTSQLRQDECVLSEAGIYRLRIIH